jgi:hypothetical protein
MTDVLRLNIGKIKPSKRMRYGAPATGTSIYLENTIHYKDNRQGRYKLWFEKRYSYNSPEGWTGRLKAHGRISKSLSEQELKEYYPRMTKDKKFILKYKHLKTLLKKLEIEKHKILLEEL